MHLYAIAPWFGSKRTLAPLIVDELGEHKYYFEPMAGSMSVILAKEPAHHETVCDLHGALTNLAWVVQDAVLAPQLYDELQRVLYNDELYGISKSWLANFEGTELDSNEFKKPLVSWAYHYFIASWMGRNGTAGTQRINYQIATRWTAGGGSGPLRFRNAVASIPGWCERLRNVHIMRRNCFDVLPKVEDAEGVAIYADPPYLLSTRSNKDKDRAGGVGRYLHEFGPEDHKRLAVELQRFEKARVVVSYYDSPELEKLYPGWTKLGCARQKNLHVQNKRGMGVKEAPEVLLINGPSFTQKKDKLF